jgi:hypothetical protein
MAHPTPWDAAAAGGGIKPAPRKKGPVKKPPDKPLPLPDST